MRHVLVAVAAAVLVLAAVPAYAQYGSSLSRSPLSNVQQQDDKSKDVKTPDQKKKDESAYKDAVGRIPDKKFDPWGKVR
jgi:hypothetical protein